MFKRGYQPDVVGFVYLFLADDGLDVVSHVGAIAEQRAVDATLVVGLVIYRTEQCVAFDVVGRVEAINRREQTLRIIFVNCTIVIRELER